MHTSGKVLAFLVVLLAITASVLTAKLVQVRNSWTAKSVASKNKFNDLNPKVAAMELSRLVLGQTLVFETSC